MEYTAEVLQETVKKSFAQADHLYVMETLNMYGVEPGELERVKVQLAILKLCDCDLDRLMHYVTRAKRDYRDVLFEAENF